MIEKKDLKKEKEYTVTFIGKRYSQLERLSKGKSKLLVIIKAIDLLEKAKNMRAREEFSTPTKVFLKMLDEKEEYQLSSIPLQLKKLGNADGVKLSSTLVGQRVLIRQHRDKINEIIERINSNV